MVITLLATTIDDAQSTVISCQLPPQKWWLILSKSNQNTLQLGFKVVLICSLLGCLVTSGALPYIPTYRRLQPQVFFLPLSLPYLVPQSIPSSQPTGACNHRSSYILGISYEVKGMSSTRRCTAIWTNRHGLITPHPTNPISRAIILLKLFLRLHWSTSTQVQTRPGPVCSGLVNIKGASLFHHQCHIVVWYAPYSFKSLKVCLALYHKCEDWQKDKISNSRCEAAPLIVVGIHCDDDYSDDDKDSGSNWFGSVGLLYVYFYCSFLFAFYVRICQNRNSNQIYFLIFHFCRQIDLSNECSNNEESQCREEAICVHTCQDVSSNSTVQHCRYFSLYLSLSLCPQMWRCLSQLYCVSWAVLRIKRVFFHSVQFPCHTWSHIKFNAILTSLSSAAHFHFQLNLTAELIWWLDSGLRFRLAQQLLQNPFLVDYYPPSLRSSCSIFTFMF